MLVDTMSLADVFAAYQPPPGSWKCTCLVWNKPGTDECVCCETPRPGSKPKAAPTPAAVGSTDNPFGTLFGGGSNGDGAASANPFANIGGASTGGSANPFANIASAAPADNTASSNPFAAAGVTPAADASSNPFAGLAAAGAGAGAGAGLAPGSGFQFGSRKIRSAEELSTFFAASASTTAPKPLSIALAGLPSARRVSKSSLGGSVLVIGSGDCDQLGLGDANDLAEEPMTVAGKLKGKKVAAVGAGGLHNGAVTVDGKLWTWGCNDDKVLGRTGTENLPGPVASLSSHFITAVACGDSHMAAINVQGDVFAWGTYKGAEGYIGFATGVKRQAEPLLLRGVARYGRARSLSCGADHTAVVTTDGVAVAWGNGEQGQLGRPVVSCSLRGNRSKTLLLTPYRFVVGHGRKGLKVR